jgi:exosome complex component CSL4
VTPGDRLGLVVCGGGGVGGVSARGGGAPLVPGQGTYVRQGQILASVVGTVWCASDGEGGGEGRWIVGVAHERAGSTSYDDDRRRRPRVGSVVLGRVTRVVRPSHASVDIIAVVPDDRPSVLTLREPYPATLRREMVRPKSSLEVLIEECVRPGDVILARVHADGEREYVLTTAEAELGVVRAICEGSGMTMEAVSWKEMRCPVTLAREGRKVAKPRLA